MGEITATPERMHLVDLVTGEDFEVMFNPEQIVETLQVSYAKAGVVGLSHKPLHYTNTENEEVSIDLYALGETPDARVLVDDYRRFLKSLCYAVGDAGTIDSGAPPRVLFVWPRVWTWTCVITSLRFTSSQFAQDGGIMRFIASITLEEIRDVRLTSAEVRLHGTRRSSGGGGVEDA